MIHPDGTGLSPITKYTNGLAQRLPSLSADGSYLVYYSQSSLSGEDKDPIVASANLWLEDRHGEIKIPITQNTQAGLDTYYGAFDPFSQWILYGSFMDINGEWNGIPSESENIWISQIDGEDRYPITQNTDAGFISNPLMFSPDGKDVLFQSNTDLSGVFNGTPTGNINLWKGKVDGSDLKPLTKNTLPGLRSVGGFFFNSGQKIMYNSSSDLTGVWDGTSTTIQNIWVMNSDGSQRQPLTQFTVAHALSPSLSSDEYEIAFRSWMPLDGSDSTTGIFNIWLMNIDGSQMTPITRNTSSTYLQTGVPHFSPDGTRIAFVSRTALDGSWDGTPSESYNLWIYDLRDATFTALTQNSLASLDASRVPQVTWARAIECD